jgi:hypothetical protein
MVDPAFVDVDAGHQAGAGGLGDERETRVWESFSQATNGRCRQDEIADALELQQENLH